MQFSSKIYGTYKYYIYIYYSNYDTSLPILLDDVTCSSSDNLLLLCSHRGIGVDNCGHSEDIEITCSNSPLSSKLINFQTD